MDDQVEIFRNRIAFCRQLLSDGVSAPEAERLLKTIMELESAIDRDRPKAEQHD